MEGDQSLEDPSPVGTLGTLYLLKRSTGEKIQGFPIDAERITIGRAEDCDVRIYLPDVSKLHCDIVFDLNTGIATMNVHGANGIYHAKTSESNNSPMIRYKAPASIVLDNEDTIKLHKKLFRFEYGSDLVREATPQPVSPIKTSPMKISQPVRRRASHRMSLVPAGKTFMPLATSPVKSRRQSMPVAVGMIDRTLSGSAMATDEVPREEEDEEEAVERVEIDVVEGEEGDRVYLEQKQDDVVEPIYNRPFSTPQQVKKIHMRNTSAVPRTRKMQQPQTAPLQLEEAEEAKVDETEQILNQPPKTPRSIPLPPVSDTPYAAASALHPGPAITPKVINATPRGPLSLRKAILVKSARNVWESTKTPGVDGAIRDGDVEVRRKSLTPTKIAAYDVALPSPGDTVYDDGESEDEEEELAQTQGGQSDEAEEDDDDDDRDSVHVEKSPIGNDEEMLANEVHQVDVEDDGEEEEHPDLNDENIDELDSSLEEQAVEEDQKDAENDGSEHASELEGDHSVEINDAMDMDENTQGTPISNRPISNKFFTPQPMRNMVNKPRRSLVDIAGPPVRFNRLPSTPTGAAVTWSAPAPPGTLGKPSRRLAAAVPEEEEVVQEDYDMSHTPGTPVRNEDIEEVLAETKRRRESLATPRALPLPPSSFKSRVKDVHQTPNHPALAPTSPESPSLQLEGEMPKTPLDALKARLNTMKRQSIHRQLSTPSAPLVRANDGGRRATVGFALPSTPAARATIGQSAAFTGLPRRKFASVQSPIFPVPIKTETSSFGQSTPLPKFTFQTTAALNDILPQRNTSDTHVETLASEDASASEDDASENEEDEKPLAQDVATPNKTSVPHLPLTGMKHLLNPPLPPKTPNMAGLKHLFPVAALNSTPSLQGVRDLYRLPAVPATPAYNGMEEMFASPEVAEEVEDVLIVSVAKGKQTSSRASKTSQSASASIVVAKDAFEDTERTSPVSAPKRGRPVKSRSVKPAAIVESEEEEVEPLEHVSPISAPKRARSAVQSKTLEQSTVAKKPSRAKVSQAEIKGNAVAAEPVTKTTTRKAVSAPCRSRRTASVDAETDPKIHVATSSKRAAKQQQLATIADESVIIVVSDSESLPAPAIKKSTTLLSTGSNSRTKSAPSRSSSKATQGIDDDAVNVGQAEDKSKPKPKPRGRPQILRETETQDPVADNIVVGPNGAKSKKPTADTFTTSSSKTTASTTTRKPRTAAGATSSKEVVDKENDDSEIVAPMSKVAAKRKTAAASAKKAMDEDVVPAVSTRSTRSRKV